jgi:hypothetical protein
VISGPGPSCAPDIALRATSIRGLVSSSRCSQVASLQSDPEQILRRRKLVDDCAQNTFRLYEPTVDQVLNMTAEAMRKRRTAGQLPARRHRRVRSSMRNTSTGPSRSILWRWLLVCCLEFHGLLLFHGLLFTATHFIAWFWIPAILPLLIPPANYK